MRLRPLCSGLILSAAHFTASMLIVPLTLKVGGAWPQAADAFVYHGLALATRMLYFPVLALALYPRHWFPGHLITIPIAVNSLLWGAALAVGMGIGSRLLSRSAP